MIPVVFLVVCLGARVSGEMGRGAAPYVPLWVEEVRLGVQEAGWRRAVEGEGSEADQLATQWEPGSYYDIIRLLLLVRDLSKAEGERTRQLEEATSTIKILTTQLDEVKTQVTKLTQGHDHHHNTLDKLHTEHRIRLQQVEEEHEARHMNHLKYLITHHNDEIQQLKSEQEARHQSHLDQLTAQHNDEITQRESDQMLDRMSHLMHLEAHHNEEIDEIKSEHDARLLESQNHLMAKLDKHQQKMQKQKAAIAKYKKDRDHHHNYIDQLHTDHHKHLRRVEDELDAWHMSNFEHLIDQHKDEKDQLKSEQEDQETRHQSHLDHLTA